VNLRESDRIYKADPVRASVGVTNPRIANEDKPGSRRSRFLLTRARVHRQDRVNRRVPEVGRQGRGTNSATDHEELDLIGLMPTLAPDRYPLQPSDASRVKRRIASGSVVRGPCAAGNHVVAASSTTLNPVERSNMANDHRLPAPVRTQ